MAKQPFKSLEEFHDDAGFEYLPSEQSSQAHIDELNEGIQESLPHTYTVQQEMLSPNKIRQSNQSLVYSASSYQTDVIGSPQFYQPQMQPPQQQHPPQPHILVNNTQAIPEHNRVSQMVQNLQQIHTSPQSGEVQVYPANLASYQTSNKASTMLKHSGVAASPAKSIQPDIYQNGQLVQQLQAEVASLNEQLTQERLNSEQLRVYNHIIKHELEKKLINHGVFIVSGRTCKQQTPTKKQQRPVPKEAAIDLYLEMQHNRIQMQALQSEFKQKDTIIKHLEVQARQQNDIAELVRRHDNELQEQNEKLQESIKQAMESINHANATITGLEDEKAGLISCIEEEEAVIKELKSKFEQEKSQSDKLRAQIKSIYDQLDESNRQIAMIERNNKQEKMHQSQIDDELMEKERLLQENEDQRKNLSKLIADKQKEIMQYQLQLSESNNKIIEYEQANRDLSRQFNESIQQIGLFKKQHNEQQSEINILNDNLEQLTYEYETYMSKTDRLEKQVQDSERMVQERNAQLKHKDEQLSRLSKKNQKLQESSSQQQLLENKVKELQLKLHELFMQKEKENMELEQDRQVKVLEITSLMEQVGQQQRENKDLKEQNQQFSNERQQIMDEVERFQSMFEKERVERIKLEAEISAMEEKYENSNKQQAFALQRLSQEEFEHLQHLLREEQFRNAQLEDELKHCKGLLQERDTAMQKLNSLQLKYQAETEYYQQLVSDLQMKASATQYYDVMSQRLPDTTIKQAQFTRAPQSLRTSNNELFEKGPLPSSKNASQDCISIHAYIFEVFFKPPPPQNQNQDVQNIPVKQTTIPKRRYYL